MKGQKGSLFILSAHMPVLSGGAKMLLRLLRWWPDHALMPILIAPTEAPLTRKARALGIHVMVIPEFTLPAHTRPLSWLLYLPRYLRALRKFIKVAHQMRARAILAQNRRMLLMTLPAAIILRIPRIWQVGLGFNTMINRLINYFCLRMATMVVLESKQQARSIFGLRVWRASSRIRIIPKGVDLQTHQREMVTALPQERVARACNKRLRIGTAGTITHRKGVDVLLHAAIEAADVIEEVIIAGKPVTLQDLQYKAKLEAICAKRECLRVTFLGWVNDMASFYKQLDIFVIASRNEGISGAAREAMLAGVPVIATDVGGMRDLIQHGETGLLVPPNDPMALAAALRMLASDPEMRISLARTAREKVKTIYDPKIFAQRYYKLVEQLLQPTFHT